MSISEKIFFSFIHNTSSLKNKSYLLLITFCLLLCGRAIAQNNDSIKVVEPLRRTQVDTIKIQSYATRYVPRKASFYAAIMPGLGQIYNKKYWKLPLVYGGFASIGYGLNFYQNLYTDYKAQLFDVLETGQNSKNPGIGQDILRPAIDRVRRERDFMIILMAGMYILQIVDANIDAHLKEFDVNPYLKRVRIEPSVKSSELVGRTAGVSIILRL